MSTNIFRVIAPVIIAVTGLGARAQDFDPCNAMYEGVWARKEGRKMWIDLSPKSGANLTVVVGQRNGEETLAGTCHRNDNGTVNVVITGGSYGGELVVSLGGYAVGTIGGSVFKGPAH